MRNFLIILFLSFSLFGVSQKLSYEITGVYSRSLIQEKLKTAQTMADVIPYYPSSWMVDYISGEIEVISNGKPIKAKDFKETLSTEQKDLLNKIDLGTDIRINIQYTSKNAVNGKIESSTMHFRAKVGPAMEAEAQFPGGSGQLSQYLQANAFDGISENMVKKFNSVFIKFTINEEGEIVNAKILNGSQDPAIDKLLLSVLNKMPKWTPAKNAGGSIIKEDFEFKVSSPGGC